MTQEAIALRTTGGSYPGLSVIQDINKALATLGTDFAGPDDPAALAGPFMTWADTGNLLLKRRNAANSDWITQHAIDPIATQPEVDAGADDTKFVTPKKMRWGVSWLANAVGYVALPSWLGGFVIQWGNSGTTASGANTPTFAIPFPNIMYTVSILQTRAAVGGVSFGWAYVSLGAMNVYASAAGIYGYYYIAVGR